MRRSSSEFAKASHSSLEKSASVLILMIGEPSDLRTQMVPDLVQKYLKPAHEAKSLVRRNQL